ncbi:hypothetical protein L6452_38205 [Arctium lappa]|uniref:Uncharacterized protein n=1 Tax=Arctium lappa TaxID=4217 RepID=A0ACB8Y5Q7_ARCLA|nr:hypothetical protein L6452_38205 [Arctium lappa]
MLYGIVACQNRESLPALGTLWAIVPSDNVRVTIARHTRGLCTATPFERATMPDDYAKGIVACHNRLRALDAFKLLSTLILTHLFIHLLQELSQTSIPIEFGFRSHQVFIHTHLLQDIVSLSSVEARVNFPPSSLLFLPRKP